MKLVDSNIIINIPHSSTIIPELFLEKIIISKDELKQEVELLTDLYTDDLFENKDCNIIKADVSRIVCDTERFRDDKKEKMSKIGMGVIYKRTSNGKDFIKINSEYRNMILSKYYDPYHDRFEKLTGLILNTYGRCVIIDGHSFSVELLKRLHFPIENIPDICIGFEEEFCDKDILYLLKEHFENNDLSVSFNYPYSGSIVPNKQYINKDTRVKSLMIEINKSIYLCDNNKNIQYQRIKNIINEAINKIVEKENRKKGR